MRLIFLFGFIGLAASCAAIESGQTCVCSNTQPAKHHHPLVPDERRQIKVEHHTLQQLQNNPFGWS